MFDWFDEFKATLKKEISLGTTKFILNTIGQPFEVPESARPLQLIQNFCPSNTQIPLDNGITIEENTWKVEFYRERKKY